jgi:hypothetical protein
MLNGLLIKALDVLVQVLYADLREVNLGPFRFLQRYDESEGELPFVVRPVPYSNLNINNLNSYIFLKVI